MTHVAFAVSQCLARIGRCHGRHAYASRRGPPRFADQRVLEDHRMFSGAAPIFLAAVRKTSGSGLPRLTSSAVTISVK